MSEIDRMDERWYQRAVFYEVSVRSFFDANGDGTGDLQGLIEKLDYLSWLGVDCLWLLPFYSSPLRDGGYDIAEFFTILPEYGKLGDAVRLMEEAHRREVERIFPAGRGRIHRLGRFGGFDVPDPYRQPRAAFEQSLALIERGIGDFARAFWKAP